MIHFVAFQIDFDTVHTFCSSQPSIVHWLSSSIFPCSVVVRPSRYGNIRPNLHFFNIYRHTSLVLTQFHLKPSSTKLYWPSTTKYQPVPPHIDPTPPNTEQNCLLSIQYYNVSSSSASLHWPNKHLISTHTAVHWPITTKYEPVQPHTDPAPLITNLYRLLLTKYHHVSTSSSPYWPSATKYEPLPPILAQYHQYHDMSNYSLYVSPVLVMFLMTSLLPTTILTIVHS